MENQLNRLDFESFKPLFHSSWHKFVQPFIESEECWKIYQFLKERGKKYNILPKGDRVFRCFLECPYDELKVVCMGMEPYASIYQGKIVCDGLSFSCGNTLKQQPSLSKLVEGIEQDVYSGLCLECENPCDLTYLANSGVLLSNVSLTVEEKRIGSHTNKGLWLPFWKYMIEEVFNKYNNGIIYLLLGKEAQKVKPWILPFNSYVLEASHPSFAARTHSDWQHNNIFSKTNKLLLENNGQGAEIQWLKTHEK